MKRIVVLGPPGAGKRTQTGRLAARLGVGPVYMGELLRGAVGDNTEFGRSLGKRVKEGNLVSDEVVLSLVETAMRGMSGFVMDGFPRTVAQLRAFNDILTRTGQSLDRAILIDVPGEEIMRRLVYRKACRTCGATQNNSLTASAVCPSCGGELTRREDDDPAVVCHRVAVYWEQTYPVVFQYDLRRLLVRASGVGPLEDVTEDILSSLNSHSDGPPS